MKKDIHPEYVETEVTCTCGNTFTTRSTATSGTIHADVCSQCHPFYTGKQKILDTGGRVARFEARYAKKTGCRRGACRGSRTFPVARYRRRPTHSVAGPAPCLCQRLRGARSADVRSGRGLLAEHAELEGRLGAPETHADARLAKQLNQRYAELSAIIGAWREWQQYGDDARAPPASWPPRTRRSPTRSTTLRASSAARPRSGCAGCWCRATRPTTRTRSSR